MKNQKMINSAKNMDTLVKVMGRIFEVVCVVLAVFALLVVIFGTAMFEKGSLTLDLDFVTIRLAEEYQQVTNGIELYAIVGLLAAAGVCIAVSVICRLLGRILAPMKDGRPFEPGVDRDLRKIGWVVLAAGTVWQVAGCVLNLLLIRSYPMEQIFSSDAISGIEYTFVFDLGFVLIACAIFLLSYIFTYGQQLQQESDETL